MKTLDELIKEYYDIFCGLPNNNPIVRQNQENDAFEIVVLETLYGEELGIDIEKNGKAEIDKILKHIVAPPDAGIDIVVEHEDIDGNKYDFIQVKNSELAPVELEQALMYMENSVNKYIKNPSDVTVNLKSILSETDLGEFDKTNCKYIVVHKGIDNYFKGQKEEKTQIVTTTELDVIRNASKSRIPRVSLEQFKSDSFNNFILYEEAEEAPAILMNLRGYDLATLAIKYTNTSLGRNILFGQNLRETLGGKSKTYVGMEDTIRTEPEKFWFYNNGITIIAEDFDTEKASDKKTVDKITLKDFSIINGAQTTSALGQFLKNARMDQSNDDIENLKNVYVLARILKVTDQEFKSRIAIYNNTQNPITTRDMASNRTEQVQLYNRLINGDDPHMYVEIRRGMKPPKDVKLYKHQSTTNEDLAQLAYAGFMRDPFTAKDKKSQIFDTDYKQTDYVINKFYHDIFHFDYDSPQGVLFKKSKQDINELLFAHYLYKEAKRELNKTYKQRIAEFVEKNKTASEDEIKSNEGKIANYEKLKAICNVCALYCLTYYYCFKNEFENVDKDKVYDYKKFYSDNVFKKELVEGFRNTFLSSTIQVINELTTNAANLNTWVRDKKSSVAFLKKVSEKLEIDMQLEDGYKKYTEKYKKNFNLG